MGDKTKYLLDEKKTNPKASQGQLDKNQIITQRDSITCFEKLWKKIFQVLEKNLKYKYAMLIERQIIKMKAEIHQHLSSLNSQISNNNNETKDKTRILKAVREKQKSHTKLN